MVHIYRVSAGASEDKLGVGYLSRDARLGDIDHGNQADCGIFGLPGELTLWLWSGFYGCAPMSPGERHVETSHTKDPNPKCSCEIHLIKISLSQVNDAWVAEIIKPPPMPS